MTLRVLAAVLLACFTFSSLVSTTTALRNTSSDAVNVRWIEGTPSINHGSTFGLPWPRGRYPSEAVAFSGSTDDGGKFELQSWVTSSWADGTVKWTGHAIPGSDTVPESLKVTASASGNLTSSRFRLRSTQTTNMTVINDENEITVSTGKLTASFPKSGAIIVRSLTASNGKTVGENGRLVLRSQSAIDDDVETSSDAAAQLLQFESKVNETTVDDDGPARTLITVRGTHQINDTGSSTAGHADWLPFILRFYLYADSESIRVIHTLIYDGDTGKDFITGIGLRFDVPLAGEEMYDRHIRLAGSDGGFLSEAVQGITGLRRDPGEEVRQAQFNGSKTPDTSTWDTRVTSRLQWIPTWNDYSLTQLSPDGFTLKKRTKAGQSWIKIPGGSRSGGLAYLGGATVGGLAVGLRDFWKRYPTSIDVTNAASDLGSITLWLYSPAAEPMDQRPFHDGMGEDTYAKQSDALEITYEDYEEGWNTPYGIATTHELFIRAFDATPSSETLAAFTEYTNKPPVLMAEPEYIRSTEAAGTYWDVPLTNTTAAQTIETHLDFLNRFYQGQVEQRKWYGFWDHGDIMHTYDEDRHTWRYDVGGYAWDNSELSPNLFFWNYFLRTGRSDVYRFTEAHTRHTSEVDVYHIGPFKGFGTRHGVQHWSDSSKQIRVSTPIYRQIYYYVSGGDERTGEIIHSLVGYTFLVVDPRRKVRDDSETYVPSPTAIDLDLGLDWAGLATAWLLEWERRGPRWQEAKTKLMASMQGIANLTNGFVTGLGSYNMYTGAISPPATDPRNLGNVTVSHLTASFGLPEIIAQLIEYLGEDMPAGFVGAWDDYCYYYGASAAEQAARYGVDFGSLSLRQGHSRLTAYLARKTGNATLAARAWDEFLNMDGLAPDEPWSTVSLNGSQVLVPVEEASWISTNDAALYGLAGIENLAQIGDALSDS
ncbi:hypothetical protein F5Y15DRAFT_429352 [Xylariaceae sp. FL0016]|nr:hypothetical protein F5Y15DRAFT_429352 [Xylariaceae sp. FL0016]